MLKIKLCGKMKETQRKAQCIEWLWLGEIGGTKAIYCLVSKSYLCKSVN